jgi:phosphate transport system protein
VTRENFDRDLFRLQEDVAAMGTRAGEAIHRAIEALRNRDLVAAEAVIAEDEQIDALHMELEARCMRLLATQQPMARDLRTIASVFAITIDIERMADHAEGISRATKRLGREPLVKPLVDIPKMDELVQEMLREALAAFRTHDADRATRMAKKDDLVDSLRSQVFRDLLEIMIRDPATVPRALELVLIAQHLERAADHITNIGERVVYMVTGELRELNV